MSFVISDILNKETIQNYRDEIHAYLTKYPQSNPSFIFRFTDFETNDRFVVAHFLTDCCTLARDREYLVEFAMAMEYIQINNTMENAIDILRPRHSIVWMVTDVSLLRKLDSIWLTHRKGKMYGFLETLVADFKIEGLPPFSLMPRISLSSKQPKQQQEVDVDLFLIYLESF